MLSENLVGAVESENLRLKGCLMQILLYDDLMINERDGWCGCVGNVGVVSRKGNCKS